MSHLHGAARLALLVTAVALLSALAPSPATAAVKRFKASRASGAVHAFDVSRVRHRDVVAARLTAQGRRRPVSARRVERVRKVVRVKVPRKWGRVSRRATRLVVSYRRVKAARKGKGPKRAPQPAPEPAPTDPVDPVEPAPAPGPSTGSCAMGEVGGGKVPAGCWRPYSDASPFNTPIPADARVAADSAAIVSKVVSFGTPNHLTAGLADTESDYSHPTYYSSASDPLFTLRCTRSWGTCPIEGMQVRVPDAARAAGGGDHHLTVVDPASGWEYDLYDVETKPAGGGTLTFGWGGRTRIDGDGTGSAATASGFGNLAGIIRAQEMRAGEIRHALFMVVKCDSGGYVYPARKNGRSCSALGLPTGDAPPMGTRFQLAMSDAQIDALAVPAWKKTILRAMARYGMYMGDTGTSAWGLQFESGSTYTSFGLQDAMVTFGQDVGVPTYNGNPVFNLRDGVDWARHLRVIDPCTTQGTC